MPPKGRGRVTTLGKLFTLIKASRAAAAEHSAVAARESNSMYFNGGICCAALVNYFVFLLAQRISAPAQRVCERPFRLGGPRGRGLRDPSARGSPPPPSRSAAASPAGDEGGSPSSVAGSANKQIRSDGEHALPGGRLAIQSRN